MTKPEFKRETDSKTGVDKCYVCVRIDNKTKDTVKRTVSFFHDNADEPDPIETCTQEVEVKGLHKVGANESYGSEEVCCRISCPEGTERYLVAMGTKLDPNGLVDLDKADAKKSLKVKKDR